MQFKFSDSPMAETLIVLAESTCFNQRFKTIRARFSLSVLTKTAPWIFHDDANTRQNVPISSGVNNRTPEKVGLPHTVIDFDLDQDSRPRFTILELTYLVHKVGRSRDLKNKKYFTGKGQNARKSWKSVINSFPDFREQWGGLIAILFISSIVWKWAVRIRSAERLFSEICVMFVLRRTRDQAHRTLPHSAKNTIYKRIQNATCLGNKKLLILFKANLKKIFQ